MMQRGRVQYTPTHGTVGACCIRPICYAIYFFISDRKPITKHANPQMATRMP